MMSSIDDAAARCPLPDASASDCKAGVEAEVARLQLEAAELRGKAHSRDRTERGRAISALRSHPRYVDACRVAKGLSPVHGNFLDEAAASGSEPSVGPEEAADLAAQAERALQELEPPKKRGPRGHDFPPEGLPEDTDAMMQEWRERMGKLEAQVAAGLPSVPPEDVDELESIAGEVVAYMERLRKACGYSNQDLAEDPDLQQVEERLDKLASVLLADLQPKLEPEEESADDAMTDLKDRERKLSARLVRHHEDMAGLSPSETKELEQIIGEVADLKAQLRIEGLLEHEQDRDEAVMMRLVRLGELRQKEHHDKKHKHAKRTNPEFVAALQELEELRGDIGVYKRRLRDESGYSNKDFKLDPVLASLEERLAVLRKFGGA